MKKRISEMLEEIPFKILKKQLLREFKNNNFPDIEVYNVYAAIVCGFPENDTYDLLAKSWLILSTKLNEI